MAIFFRQEIYVYNMIKCPAELVGHDLGIDDSLEPASDLVWASRMVSHAAEISNCAYGSEPQLRLFRIDSGYSLKNETRAKPPSFRPLNDSEDVLSLGWQYQRAHCTVT